MNGVPGTILETVCGTLSFLTLSLRDDSTLVSGALADSPSLLLEQLLSKLGNQFRCLLVSSFTLGMGVLLLEATGAEAGEPAEAVAVGGVGGTVVSVFC